MVGYWGPTYRGEGCRQVNQRQDRNDSHNLGLLLLLYGKFFDTVRSSGLLVLLNLVVTHTFFSLHR